MFVQKLKSISLNGVEGEAYGGNIYSFKIEGNGIDGPPRYIISAAFPPSTAPTPALNSLGQIKIGDFSLGGNVKLFASSVENMPEYSSLHLTYVDNSDFLDKTYIGINYRHGYCEKSVCKSDGFVLLGGEVVETESAKECLNCADQIVEASGKILYNTCDNKDAGYSVGHFIQAFANEIKNISLLGRAGSAPVSYTGTLREVLSNLCSDAGATFMVDYNGGITIIDGSKGVQILDQVLGSDAKIKKSTYEQSKEGSYIQLGSTFSIKPTRTLSQTRENYTQIILYPQSTIATIDVQLGYVSLRGPMWRDQVCKQLGLYNRLGFYGGLYSVNPGAGMFQNSMTDLANCMQDSSLLDLIGQGFTYWHLTRFSDELKNYYINLESNAAQEFGTVYKANLIPITTESKSCISNSFRKLTNYEYYPDIDANGYWRKNVSSKDIAPEKIRDLDGYYAPVVVPLVGELTEKYKQCVGSLNRISDYTNMAFIAWKSNLPGVSIESSMCVHPDEELKKPINQKDTYCLLPCEQNEGSSDPCAQLNSNCSRGPAGIYQGSESNLGFCLGGIVSPSTSVYYGWMKKNDDVSRVAAGELKINDKPIDSSSSSVMPGYADTSNVQSVRYSLVDASNSSDSISPPVGSFFIASQTRTYEIIGEFVPQLHPSLKSWSISTDGNGTFTTISYQNRPPIPSKQDSSMSKVSSKKVLLRS